MEKVGPLSSITLKEGVRSKLFFIIVFFGVLFVLSSIALSDFTFAEREKILLDMGLSFMIIFGLIIILVLGINLLHKDMDKRTIYFVLSKAVKRGDYIVGKYIGLLSIVFLLLILMAIINFLLLIIFVGKAKPVVFLALYPIALELMVVSAYTIFFATFTTPSLIAFFTLGVYAIGHSYELLTFTLKRSGKIGEIILKVISYLIPNLEILDFKSYLVYGKPIQLVDFLWITIYALLYVFVLVFIAQTIFRWRELK